MLIREMLHSIQHVSQKKAILCLSLTSLCSLHTEASVTIAETSPIEVRGVMAYQGKYQFSVYNAETRARSWIGIEQNFAGIQIHSYDSEKGLIQASYGEQEIVLSLAPSSRHPDISRVDNEENSDRQLPKIGSEAEIPALVAAYQTAQLEALPDTKHPLYDLIKQTATNRVQSYQNELEASLVPEIAAASPSELSPRIGSLRTGNNVNSRPWASDHIELHGAPE